MEYLQYHPQIAKVLEYKENNSDEDWLLYFDKYVMNNHIGYLMLHSALRHKNYNVANWLYDMNSKIVYNRSIYKTLIQSAMLNDNYAVNWILSKRKTINVVSNSEFQCQRIFDKTFLNNSEYFFKHMASNVKLIEKISERKIHIFNKDTILKIFDSIFILDTDIIFEDNEQIKYVANWILKYYSHYLSDLRKYQYFIKYVTKTTEEIEEFNSKTNYIIFQNIGSIHRNAILCPDTTIASSIDDPLCSWIYSKYKMTIHDKSEILSTLLNAEIRCIPLLEYFDNFYLPEYGKINDFYCDFQFAKYNTILTENESALLTWMECKISMNTNSFVKTQNELFLRFVSNGKLENAKLLHAEYAPVLHINNVKMSVLIYNLFADRHMKTIEWIYEINEGTLNDDVILDIYSHATTCHESNNMHNQSIKKWIHTKHSTIINNYSF